MDLAALVKDLPPVDELGDHGHEDDAEADDGAGVGGPLDTGAAGTVVPVDGVVGVAGYAATGSVASGTVTPGVAGVMGSAATGTVATGTMTPGAVRAGFGHTDAAIVRSGPPVALVSGSSVSRTSEVEIGTFGGESTESVEAYIRMFEWMARIKGWSPDERVFQLLRRLRGSARNWSVTAVPDAADGVKWDDVKARLVRAFSRLNQGPSPATRIMSLRQGPQQSVQKYREEFEKVMLLAKIPPDSVLYRDFFVSGLRDEIRSIARAHVEQLDMDSLYFYAAAREADLASRGGQSGQPRGGQKQEQASPQQQQQRGSGDRQGSLKASVECMFQLP